MAVSEIQARSIRAANSRLNIWEGAVRSSKTIASLYRWIQFCGSPKTPKDDLLIVGRTERSTVRNVVRPLERMLGNNCNYLPGKAECWIFDRCCHVIGASDERSEGKIRGMTAGGAYGDEITLWPESFWVMLLSRLSPDDAAFFGSTNPDNPYHYLKKGFLNRRAELDMSVFKFKLDDNPFLSKRFKDNLKKEYLGLWYKRFILGLWVMAEGAIYDFFDEDEHTIIKPPGIAKQYYVGIDYGTGNPTCFLLFGVHPLLNPRIWCEREYYYDSQNAGRQKDDAEYADDFVKWLGNIKPTALIIDPSAASFKVALAKKGMFNIVDADNEVLTGIRTQSRLLGSGEYKICSCCNHTIEDYGAYLWDKNAAKKGEDKPLKQNDHSKDPERYILNTLEGPESSLVYYKMLTKT
jgi:PBSX family phage terminase large subunit